MCNGKICERLLKSSIAASRIPLDGLRTTTWIGHCMEWADLQAFPAAQRRNLSIHEYQSVQLLNSVSLCFRLKSHNMCMAEGMPGGQVGRTVSARL
jgi:hypothetical protein